MNKLKEKYKAKIAELDARMEELKKIEFNDEVYDEMMSIMATTNRYLRAMGASEEELYDI